MKKWVAAGLALLALPVFVVVLAAALLTGTTSASGCGFGSVAMKSENSRRSSSVRFFAISFIGAARRSLSRNI